MNLQEIIQKLDLTVINLTDPDNPPIPTGGYVSDLLSCVMAGAKQGNIWVTLQAHMNIIAVAALLDLSAIIITEGAMPDAATISKAKEQDISILGTRLPSYTIVGLLWELGIKS
jgi:imidazolonepropionase-like amidohydrolase